MATKTISLEVDVYEKLKRARRNPGESFSSVIRRAVWPAERFTASQLLENLRAKMESGESLPEEEILDRLDAAQTERRRSRSEWRGRRT